MPESPLRGGSTTTTSGLPARSASSSIALPDLACEERRVRDPVQLGVLERAGDRLLGDLDPPHRERFARQREPDRARAAVEVVDRLLAGQARVLADEAVERLGHGRVRLEEGVRPDAEAKAEDLLFDRLLAPEELRRQVRDLGRAVVHRVVDRPNLWEAAQRLDEGVGLVEAARRGHEDDQGLTGVAPFANDEVTEVAALVLLVVGLEGVLARPVLDRVSDRVPEVGREPAARDVDHLVPAARAVEAEVEAAVCAGENEYSSLFR